MRVKALPLLRRLNLSYCNLRDRLSVVLDAVRQQRLVYMNLKDTRLNEDDLFFLAAWRTLAGLRELNLSCNDLQHLDQVVIAMLERMPHITCLSISFCSLSVGSQVSINVQPIPLPTVLVIIITSFIFIKSLSKRSRDDDR